MVEENHIPRVCAKCGGQLPRGAEVCPWCSTPAARSERPQRIRVRKKRSVLKTYIEHVRRHWLYFFLAVVAGLAAAWLLLNFAQRAARPTAPAPASIILTLTAFPPRH